MNPTQPDLLDDAPAPRLQAWDPAHWPVAPGWKPVVDDFLASVQGQALAGFVRGRLRAGAVVYPPRPFRALELTPPQAVHAVILGQDPYHGAGQAEGLAFSVAPGVRVPPSLRNILAELGEPGGRPSNGSLAEWAARGVLLLNTCLTVEEGVPASHAGRGWEALTDALIGHVAAHASPCVFMLWGAHAQAKAGLIEAQAARHGREALVLKANHPSPLSARRPPVPFLGCGHFRLAGDWLSARGVAPIWEVATPGA